MDHQTLLANAVAAIGLGDHGTGQRLLAQLLRDDPNNAQAWLWMSEVAATAAQRRECVIHALLADPMDPAARAALDRLDARTTSSASPPPAPPLGESVPQPSSAVVPEDQNAPWSAAPVFPAPAPTAGIGGRLPGLGSAVPPRPQDAQESREITEAHRRRAYRNTMLAGAMALTLALGLFVLLIVVTIIVPRARQRIRSTPERVFSAATLWCPLCEQAGDAIVLWERPGEGAARGDKTGELPHGTPVSVLAETWSEAQGRAYLKVSAQDQTGWVSETFVQQ